MTPVYTPLSVDVMVEAKLEQLARAIKAAGFRGFQAHVSFEARGERVNAVWRDGGWYELREADGS